MKLISFSVIGDFIGYLMKLNYFDNLYVFWEYTVNDDKIWIVDKL